MTSLTALRVEYAEHAGRSLALPIAGVVVWTAVGLAALGLEQQTATTLLVFATGTIFPIALLLARHLGEHLLDNPSPLAGLMGRSVLMVNLLWAVHLSLLARDPAFVPLTLGIGLGLHWLVFSWVVGRPVGTIHAFVRTALITAAWWGAPGHRVSAVSAAVVFSYLVTIPTLASTGPRGDVDGVPPHGGGGSVSASRRGPGGRR